MKKIIKKICRFIGKIIQFFDRIIITPIMKIAIKITDVFKSNSKGFEKILVTKQALLIISLIISCVAFYIVDKNTNFIIDNQAEILNSQPVTAIYNEEAYVVEGLPETVDVVLVGKKSHIYLAKQQPNQKITVDLRELSTGTHKVSLKYSQVVGSVEYKIDPSKVTVVIYDKVSSTRELTYDILNRDKLDSKLDIASVTLSKTEVTVKGSQKQVDAVAYVKALIDVENVVDPVVGTTNVNGIKLVAYDINGGIVDVEILPETVDATLKLVSSSKEVPIKIIPNGNLAVGYAIESLTASTKTVTVYGGEESLANISYVPVYIDINDINADKDFTVNITKPVGVREVSLKTLTVKLTVGNEVQKEIEITDIQIINLDSKLKAQAGSESDSKITAIVKGTENNLNELDETTIKAVVDLAEYNKTGKYDVEVKVIGEDLRINYSSKTKKIGIRIYDK